MYLQAVSTSLDMPCRPLWNSQHVGERRASCGHVSSPAVVGQAQTPSLKRSRSIVTCDGHSHAICASTGDTVLQPGKPTSPSRQRTASAEPFVISPIAHILACADENGRGHGAFCTGKDMQAAVSSHLPPVNCTRDQALPFSGEVPGRPVSTPSYNAHAYGASTEALRKNAGGMTAVDLHRSAVSTAVNDASQSGESAGSCCSPPILLMPFPDKPGSLARCSVDSRSWFGANRHVTRSVGIQTNLDCPTIPSMQQQPFRRLCEWTTRVQCGSTAEKVTSPPEDSEMHDDGIKATRINPEHMPDVAVPNRACCSQRLSPSGSFAAALPHPRAAADVSMEVALTLQQAQENWRRQVDVIQQFAREHIVPLLARCARGPPDEAVVRHCASPSNGFSLR